MSTTAQQLCDRARVRHAAFFNVALPDGALLLALHSRQRTMLLDMGRQVEALLSTTAEVAAIVSGSLVGVDALGVPSYSTSANEGYAVSFDAMGVPYVDTDSIPVTNDPYGENGGTPGFPLPDGFIKAVAGAVVYDDNSEASLTILTERARLEAQPSGPVAFVSGNRLVAIRSLREDIRGSDSWSRVASVRLSYVGLPSITALSDVLNLPPVVEEVLEAGLAELMALSSKELSGAEKSLFVQERKDAEGRLKRAGNDILGDVTDSSVLFMG
jgi:hypothetical protein